MSRRAPTGVPPSHIMPGCPPLPRPWVRSAVVKAPFAVLAFLAAGTLSKGVLQKRRLLSVRKQHRRIHFQSFGVHFDSKS
jgi:hypothetical protein